MNEQYIFGNGDMPEWVSGRLYYYKRDDGKTGYEIDTGKHDKVIFEGDLLIKQGKYIKVIRGGCNGSAKEVD